MGIPTLPTSMGRAAIPEPELAPAPAPVAPPPAAEPARQRRALIVDDSRVVRKVSRPILESCGYQVSEAENGEEALARCRADMPDLVLLDWDMPVMTGIEFITKLRGLESAHRPLAVFCTSRSDTSDIVKGIEAGADEYITKPFNDASLKEKLQRIGAI